MRFIIFLCIITSFSFGALARDWSDPQQTPYSESYGRSDIRIGDHLFIDGEIHDEQVQRLRDGDFRGVTHVVLNSRGGSGPAGIELAYEIQRQKLTTLVPAGGVCMSACMFAFQAGVQRIIYSSTVFMFHGPRLYVANYLDSELCNDKGRSHCQTKAIENALKDAIVLMEIGNDNQPAIYDLMESLGTDPLLRSQYIALPLIKDKKTWLEADNFYRRGDLYFTDYNGEDDHQGMNKFNDQIDVISPMQVLIDYNIATEIRP